MDINLLSPVSDHLIEITEPLHSQSLGKKIKLHTDNYFPAVEDLDIAIFGVVESRQSEHSLPQTSNIDQIRKSFYSLFPGNWDCNIADLGNINTGNSVKDTYFAVASTVEFLLKKNVIPIIIGKSQDITFANYRSYDKIKSMINIVNIDKSFDLGDSSKPITNTNYIGKIILEKPYNLYNYSVVGFQTYYNSQEEIDLMDKLYFEFYRLGEVNRDIKFVEPILRDADLVSIDLNCIKSSELRSNKTFSPNGFDSREICAISRYAGISNKVSSFGIYEYDLSLKDGATSELIAQMIWYFIEGYYCRIEDDNFKNSNEFMKYNVLVQDHKLVFHKSLKTGRWWVETPFLKILHTKSSKNALLACTEDDYDKAVQGIIPERWYKAYKKN